MIRIWVTAEVTYRRRQSGLAFGVTAAIESDSFQWITGEELLSTYQSSPEASRIFCRICGSNFGVMEDGEVTYLSLGTVTGDPGSRLADHIFVGSKAPWYEIADCLPQHDEWPQAD
jgi:hypothetical protein